MRFPRPTVSLTFGFVVSVIAALQGRAIVLEPVASAGGNTRVGYQDSAVIQLRPILRFDGGDETPIYRPRAVAVADDGNIYVLDAGNFRVAVYSDDGQFIRSFGRSGQGPGEFGSRTDFDDDLAVSATHVATLHRLLRRINLFDRTGRFIRSIKVGGGQATSVALANDELIVGVLSRDHDAPSVHRYSMAGKRLGSFGGQVLENPRRISLNLSYASVDGRGRILTIQRWWPLVTAHGVDGVAASQDAWIDFAWSDNRALRLSLLVVERRDLLEHRRADIDAADLRIQLSFDVEPRVQDDGWWLLLAGGHVLTLSTDLKPLATYRLMNADGDENVLASDIGLSPDGSRVCANNAIDHDVLCYSLNPGPADYR